MTLTQKHLLELLTLALMTNYHHSTSPANTPHITPATQKPPTITTPPQQLPKQTILTTTTHQTHQTPTPTYNSLRNYPTPVPNKTILNIRSSTITSWLNPTLKKQLKSHNITFQKKNITSNNLTHPNFYD